MSKVNFEHVAPYIGQLLTVNRGLWRVSYHNEGQKRVSIELVAIIIAMHQSPAKARIQLSETGEIMSLTEFEEIRRRRWPQKHEVGRNPNNATLGVRNGVMGAKGGL